MYKHACIQGTERGTLVPVFVLVVHSMRIVCIILTRFDFGFFGVCVLSGSLSSTYTYMHVLRALTEALWCLYLCFACSVAS
jgi:hypothetical protein